MQTLRLTHAAPVRYALAFAGLSTLAMGALLAVIYWSVILLLEQHLDIAIEQQQLALRNQFSNDGRDAMLGLLNQYLGDGGGLQHYLVQDRSGQVLGGDLSSIEPSLGWLDVTISSTGSGTDIRSYDLRARSDYFDEDTYVLVALDTSELAETSNMILWSFGFTLAATIAISLAGGVAIGSALLRRVQTASDAARAIMDGDLSQRIPVAGNDDEIDRLADSLNQMLARIEELMENVRHVTSDIAHDLRTPLGRLRQRLEAARLKERAAGEYEEVIDSAIADTDAVLKTFDAMLRIAQIESGGVRSRFARVDISDIADNVAEIFRPVAEDDGKGLVTDIETGIRVHGDRELLTQLLANLIENALRHTPQGTTVGVGLRMDPVGPCLVVSDDGRGIPEEERHQVLRRFYRLDASRTTPGSGLGLSLVAAVTKLHGAELSMQDNAPGLRVTIRFSRDIEQSTRDPRGATLGAGVGTTRSIGGQRLTRREARIRAHGRESGGHSMPARIEGGCD